MIMMMREKMSCSWTFLLSTMMLIMAIINTHPADAHSSSNDEDEDGCKRWCGDIYIRRPFGIMGASHCYYNESFAVSCSYSSTSSSYIAVLNKYDFELLKVGEPESLVYPPGLVGQIIVKMSSVTVCGGGNNNSISSASKSKTSIIMERLTSPDLTGSPFDFAMDDNVVASVGCDGYAVLYNETGGFAGGCSSTCEPNNPSLAHGLLLNKAICRGLNCCRINMEAQTRYSIVVSMSQGSASCRSAFLINTDDLETNAPFTPGMTTVPATLGWTIYDEKLATDSQGSETSRLLKLIFLVFITPAVGTLLVLCAGFWACWQRKTKRTRKEIKLRAKYFEERLEEQMCLDEEEIEKTKLFTLVELKSATDNFSIDNVLGRGGQGTVYKGVLKNGQVIAVKRSRELDESERKHYINEVILLSQVKHRNVVKLIGCCLESNVPLVVYEFIANGTLSEYIHSCANEFTWEMRLRIASEAANATAYLHSDCPTAIYHRDIKSSNILLDDNYRAKVSDFGISKVVSTDQTHVTTCVQGTFGYLDPEYFQSSQFSEKSDVYSFGVVLIELLTSQKPIRLSASDVEDEEISLVVYFTSLMNDSTIYHILDPVVLNGGRKEDIMAVAKLAYTCVSPTGLQRPTMKEVARVLDESRCRMSLSCTTPVTLSKQVSSGEIFESSVTKSLISKAFLRPATTNVVDVTSNFYSFDVEQRLRQTY